jgi:hypothetical protein
VNSNNSSPTRTTRASKPSYKTSHRQHPQTTAYGKQPRKPNRQQFLPNHFEQHEEHGPERTLKEHEYSQTIYQPFSSHIPLKTLQERKKPLTFNWKFLTNSNPAQPVPRSEIQTIINNLKPTSFPGYDLITGKILQELPPVGIKYLT